MNIWSLAVVIVLALMTLTLVFGVMLLIARIQDARADAITKVAMSEQAGREAVEVVAAQAQRETASYEYGRQQAIFAMRVLDLFELGKWGGGEEELRSAIIRQLDGIPPPRDAPTMAIRSRPLAQWPDGTPYNEERRL